MKGYQYNIADEMLIDNFAGGGGASTGIELATGRIVNIAVNHDKAAIEMHEKNHPYTQHFREDVFKVNPRKVTQGRPVALVWGSPDCTHFSKAKGGTPVSKKIRALAWVLCKWAGTVKPRVIIMENVEEFTTWGPVIPMRINGRCVKKVLDKKGKLKKPYVTAEKGEVLSEDEQVFVPDKKRAGQTFKMFVEHLQSLGYAVEWKVLRACDYGAPTTRKRIFLVARRDGQPIVFPNPTHGDGKGLKPFRSAAECIDLTDVGKSIFGRKRPLKENTMKRIARGLDKFLIKSPNPFIMQMRFENPSQSIDEPLSTITAVNKHYAVHPNFNPFIMSNNTNNAPHGVKEPLPTITTGNRNYLCSPSLMQIGQTGGGDRVSSIETPLKTICVKNEHCLVAPSLIQYHGEQSQKDVRGQNLNKPISTVDTANRYGLSSAFLSKYYSGDGQKGSDVQKPLSTVTAIDHNALVGVNISSRYGNGEDGRGRELDKPLPTVTGEDHNQLMSSLLIKYYSGEEQAQSVKAPLHTITSKPRFYLVNPHICTLRNNMIGQSVKDPLSTITAKAGHHAVVSAYLEKLTGDEQNLGYWKEIREMLNRYAGYNIADDEILIIDVDGAQYFISDISMRMLEPRELAKAQGFPDDYVLQVNESYSKAAQIARIGNSVCPVMAEALVRANLPELCTKKPIKTMEQLDKVLTA